MAGRDEVPDDGLVLWDPDQPFDRYEQFAPSVFGAAAARVPLHRDPRVLIALIVAAFATLVLASILLLTGGRFREGEITLRPTIRTSAVPLAPRTSTAESATATTLEAATTSADAPQSEPVSPGATGAAPVPPARSSAPAQPSGPRINVTRNPMSFTPGGGS